MISIRKYVVLSLMSVVLFGAVANAATWIDYGFDETTGLTAADDSGNGNDGTLIGFAGDDSQWISGGAVGGALDIGSLQRVTTPGGVTAGQIYTISFFVKGNTSDNSTGANRLYSEGQLDYVTNGTSYSQLRLASDGSVEAFAGSQESNWATEWDISGAASVMDDTWHHVALTNNYGDVKLYIDGALDASITYDAGAFTYLTPDIGGIGSDAGPDFSYVGGMDEFITFDTALSAAGVAALVPEHLRAGNAVKVLEYKFDETTGTTASDSEGTNNGTLVNFPGDDSQWVSGVGDPNDPSTTNALAFGSEDVVSIPVGITDNSSYSMSFFIKGSAGGNQYQSIYEESDSSTGDFVYIQLNNGFVEYEDGAGGFADVTITGGNVLDDEWHHVAITNREGRIRIYVDGILRSSGNASISLTSPTTVALGLDISSYSLYSTLDEFAIYTGCLTPEEIAQTFSDAIPAKQIIEYLFDETTGLTAADTSGNGYDGTLDYYAGDDSQWVSGLVDGALNFPGGARVLAGASSTAGQIFTISFFMKADLAANIAIENRIYKETNWEGGAGTGSGFGIRGNSSGGLDVYGGFDGWVGAFSFSSTGAAILDGTWKHIAVTNDYGTVALYIDGVLNSGTTYNAGAGGYTTPDTPACGFSHYLTDYDYIGLLDEFTSYDRALDANDIFAITEESGLLITYQGDIDGDGQVNLTDLELLVGNWLLDETTSLPLGDYVQDDFESYADTAAMKAVWSEYSEGIGASTISLCGSCGEGSSKALTWLYDGGSFNSTSDNRVYAEANMTTASHTISRIDADGTFLMYGGFDGGGWSSEWYLSSSESIMDGTWHHVAVTNNSGELFLYIDGVVDANDNYNSLDWVYSAPDVQSIGHTTPNNSFYGTLDEFTTYAGTVLSPAQIANVAAGSPVTTGRTIAHSFDETTGSTAYDSSGNGNDGTLENFPVDDSQWVSGNVNGALMFGEADRVGLPVQSTGSQIWTVCFFIRGLDPASKLAHTTYTPASSIDLSQYNESKLSFMRATGNTNGSLSVAFMNGGTTESDIAATYSVGSSAIPADAWETDVQFLHGLDFTDPNDSLSDLNDVQAIQIWATGAGTMDIDNLTLSSADCTGYPVQTGDLDENCKVDFVDFAIFANDWLNGTE